jgi:glucose/galactose transporter
MNSSPADLNSKWKNYLYSIAIMGSLFFTFGFVTWVNGSLIQFLKIACQLSGDVQAFFVTFAFYMAYFCLAIPSAYVLKLVGFKNGIVLGLLTMAIGSLVFIPAANGRVFGLFLTGLFIQGAGLTILQTASNPYVSLIGRLESAAKRISIMGICSKTAGIIAPLVLSSILLKDASVLENKIDNASDPATKDILLRELASRISLPYIILAVALFALAFFIKNSALPEINSGATHQRTSGRHSARKAHALHHRHLVLGIVCIFLYVGVEVMAGDTIGIYGRTMGISMDKTKFFTTYTMLTMLVGYIIGICTVPRIISQQTALKLSAYLGIGITCCIYISTGYTAIALIASLGLANALMWPAIFPLAIAGLGRHTKTGSGLLVMGISGGAVIPIIYALLKQPGVGLSSSFSFLLCVLPSYIYILYYSIRGYKIR